MPDTSKETARGDGKAVWGVRNSVEGRGIQGQPEIVERQELLIYRKRSRGIEPGQTEAVDEEGKGEVGERRRKKERV